jgi:diguanylate cyclase (GGDEF)-like protein
VACGVERFNAIVRPWPYRWIYALAGGAVAVGTLVGLDAFEASRFALAIASVAFFGVIGHLLGRQAEILVRACGTDALTGLWNRREFERRLVTELDRAARYPSPLALLIVDLDHLKDINDVHGHKAGDWALQCVGASLIETCRAVDCVARWGGDEFVVLAPHTRGPDAATLAGRILDAIHRFAAEGGAALPSLSASIGVAVDDSRSGHPEALFAAADRALYAAKASGGGATVLASGGRMGEVPTRPRLVPSLPAPVPLRFAPSSAASQPTRGVGGSVQK